MKISLLHDVLQGFLPLSAIPGEEVTRTVLVQVTVKVDALLLDEEVEARDTDADGQGVQVDLIFSDRTLQMTRNLAVPQEHETVQEFDVNSFVETVIPCYGRSSQTGRAHSFDYDGRLDEAADETHFLLNFIVTVNVVDDQVSTLIPFRAQTGAQKNVIQAEFNEDIFDASVQVQLGHLLDQQNARNGRNSRHIAPERVHLGQVVVLLLKVVDDALNFQIHRILGEEFAMGVDRHLIIAIRVICFNFKF